MYVLSLGLNQRRQPDSTLPFRWMEILGGFNLDILVAGLLLLLATLSANAREGETTFQKFKPHFVHIKNRFHR